VHSPASPCQSILPGRFRKALLGLGQNPPNTFASKLHSAFLHLIFDEHQHGPSCTSAALARYISHRFSYSKMLFFRRIHLVQVYFAWLALIGSLQIIKALSTSSARHHDYRTALFFTHRLAGHVKSKRGREHNVR
jgi:hypothetical protein